MSKSGRYEILPTEPPETGVLYVAPPLSHTRGTLRRLLWGSGLPFCDPLDDVLAVEVCPGGLSNLSDALLRGLTEAELRDCRAILVQKGVQVDLGVLPRMQDLFTLLNCARGTWLKKIMREDKLTVHFQPIVPVSDPGEVFAYECLLRGIDEEGALVGPEPIFGAARAAGLLYNLDRAARVKAVEEAARHGIEKNIFVNFNATSIYDPAYCLRSTMEAVEEAGIPPGRIVFEVTDSEEIKDTVHLGNIIDYYREGGFGVALDDLGTGYGSLDLLAELTPDFVKLDMGLVSRAVGVPYKASIARELIELAKDLGVIVIAEGVETEDQYRWVTAHEVDYAQGHFFARPSSTPLALGRVNP